MIKFQHKSPESYREALKANDDHSEPGQGHLHAVPGGQVFVYDLPASQVAHSTCNLDGHINQVLLRDCLKGNEGGGEEAQLRNRSRKNKKRREYSTGGTGDHS